MVRGWPVLDQDDIELIYTLPIVDARSMADGLGLSEDAFKFVRTYHCLTSLTEYAYSEKIAMLEKAET